LFIPRYTTNAYCDLFDTSNGGCLRISGVGVGELKFYPPTFVFDENLNECWYEYDEGKIKPCVIEAEPVLWPSTTDSDCDDECPDDYAHTDQKNQDPSRFTGGSPK